MGSALASETSQPSIQKLPSWASRWWSRRRDRPTVTVAKPLPARLAGPSRVSGLVRAAKNALQVGVQRLPLQRVRAIADVAIGSHEVGAHPHDIVHPSKLPGGILHDR